MAEFLSPAWIGELDDAARACTDLPDLGGRFVMEQVVRIPGRDDVRYQIRVEGNGARVVIDGEQPPDIVLLTDVATAVGLHTGALRAQDALAAGVLKVRGNPDILVRHREVLGVLERAFAGAREHTTFVVSAAATAGGDSTPEQ